MTDTTGNTSSGSYIRDQKWRYGKWPDGEKLHDITADPHERANLASVPEFGPEIPEMRQILAERRAEAISQHPVR